jgi:drug/metabolite transporter (DMT)-like permease
MPSSPSTPGSRQVVLATAMVVVAGACWGLAAVIAKTAFRRGVPPVRMAEARVVVALVLLVAILTVTRRLGRVRAEGGADDGRSSLRPAREAVPALVGFGLSVAAVNAAYYVAIDRLSVGVAISLQYTAPVLLLGLSVLTGRGRAGRTAWVAAGLTLAGAVLVSQALSGVGSVSGLGLLAASASSVFFATYLLTAEAAGRRGLDPATVLVWGFVVAILAWTVVAPWWSWPVARLSDAKILLAVLGVGIVGTLVPFFLAVRAVRVLSPATAGIAATSEPPFAAVFAWLFLSQHLTVWQIVGAGLVVAGVVLAQRVSGLSAEAVAVEPAA